MVSRKKKKTEVNTKLQIIYFINEIEDLNLTSLAWRAQLNRLMCFFLGVNFTFYEVLFRLEN